MPIDRNMELYWTVDHVLTEAECSALIGRIEALGPTEAPITTGCGFEMRPDLRNNTCVIFDDVPLAQTLFERTRSRLPEHYLSCPVSGTATVSSGTGEGHRRSGLHE